MGVEGSLWEGLAEAVISQSTRHQGLGRTLAWLSMARPARGGPANPKECYGGFKNNPPVCVWWGGGTETELRSVSAGWRALPLLHSRAPEPRTHTSMRTPVFASLGDSPLSLCMREAEPQGAEARRARELQLLLPGRAPRALCSRATNPAGGWRRQGRRQTPKSHTHHRPRCGKLRRSPRRAPPPLRNQRSGHCAAWGRARWAAGPARGLGHGGLSSPPHGAL